MLSIKVIAVSPLADANLLVFFENGTIKKFDTKLLMIDYSEFEALLNPDVFNLVKVEAGGYGVSWSEDLDCSEGELYENGVAIPLSADDFLCFSRHNIVNTAEASELLGCTRQNIEDLIKRGKIQPVKTYSKSKLFLRADIERRTWADTPKQQDRI